MDEKMLTVEEVATRLKRTKRAIQKYCDRGIFPGAKKTGPFENSRWRIPEIEVEKFLQQYSIDG